MEVAEKISYKDLVVEHLKKEERNWSWFYRQINDAAESKERPDMEMNYSKLYYTLKGAHEITPAQQEFWNDILGTDFK